MSIGFLVQDYFIDNEHDKKDIIDALERAELPYQVVSWKPHSSEKIKPELGDVDLITCIGSISFIRNIHKIVESEIPIHELFDSALHSYSSYQHQLKKEYLLNSNRFMLPFAEIVNRKFSDLSALIGTKRVLFRPDNALKVAEVELVDDNTFEQWKYNIERFSGASNSTLFWLFPEKIIHSEFRCLMLRGKCISVSKYSNGGLDIQIENVIDQAISDFAEMSSENIDIEDSLYILDIAETDQGLKVIELNCLATSGQYALDKVKVINSINDALNEVFIELYT